MVTHTSLHLATTQQFEILNITSQVEDAVFKQRLHTGLVVVSTPHTTAGIRLNHFEPLLLQDIMRTLYRLAPQDISYSHDLFELRQEKQASERSNGHAHVKAFLLGASEGVPVEGGHLMLGDRQSVLFVDCDGGRQRTVNLTLIS